VEEQAPSRTILLITTFDLSLTSAHSPWPHTYGLSEWVVEGRVHRQQTVGYDLFHHVLLLDKRGILRKLKKGTAQGLAGPLILDTTYHT
jgi:hypothetical protein